MSSATQAFSRSSRLLVVDDEQAVCKILTSLLEKRGYHVTIANSAAQTREILDTNRFDAWIFDWKLLDGNGLDLARELRERGDQTPIVFVTGFANTDMALTAASIGIKDVLSKPFSSNDLYTSVERAIAHNAPRDLVADSPADSVLSGRKKAAPAGAEPAKPGGNSGLFLYVAAAVIFAVGLLVTYYILKP